VQQSAEHVEKFKVGGWAHKEHFSGCGRTDARACDGSMTLSDLLG